MTQRLAAQVEHGAPDRLFHGIEPTLSVLFMTYQHAAVVRIARATK